MSPHGSQSAPKEFGEHFVTACPLETAKPRRHTKIAESHGLVRSKELSYNPSRDKLAVQENEMAI